MPVAETAWKSSQSGLAYLNGDWSIAAAKLPAVRWSWHDLSYHPDPRELEEFSKNYFYERIAEPAKQFSRFGARIDMIISENDMVQDQCGLPSDERYVLKQDRAGAIEQEGLCILCVWNTALPWSERMAPTDRGHSACSVHNKVCLHEAISGLDRLFEQLNYVQTGGDLRRGQRPLKGPRARSRMTRGKR